MYGRLDYTCEEEHQYWCSTTLTLLHRDVVQYSPSIQCLRPPLIIHINIEHGLLRKQAAYQKQARLIWSKTVLSLNKNMVENFLRGF